MTDNMAARSELNSISSPYLRATTSSFSEFVRLVAPEALPAGRQPRTPPPSSRSVTTAAW
jgi:hypothetical protein